jgi:hypothetical protein
MTLSLLLEQDRASEISFLIEEIELDFEVRMKNVWFFLLIRIHLIHTWAKGEEQQAKYVSYSHNKKIQDTLNRLAAISHK